MPNVSHAEKILESSHRNESKRVNGVDEIRIHRKANREECFERGAI